MKKKLFAFINDADEMNLRDTPGMTSKIRKRHLLIPDWELLKS